MKKTAIVSSAILAALVIGGSTFVGLKVLKSRTGACRFDWRSPKTYVAACNGDLDTLRALTYKDPSIDQANSLTGACPGWRPIIIAAAEGKGDAVRLLLEKGADPNLAGAKGRTALMFAARYGYDSIVDDLLNAGAQPDIIPFDGPKAIVAAGLEGQAGSIVRILKKGGTISAKDCEPNYQDGCVRIGIVLGSVFNDVEKAKEINEPLCAGGYKRSCAIMVASECLSKIAKTGDVSLAIADVNVIENCIREGAK